MSKSNSKFCKLSVQQLESRQLMAGNVLANFNSGNDLVLTGDAAGNEIHIYESSVQANRIVVQGLNGTTINGLSKFELQASVIDDIIANMHGGNDRVIVTNLTLTNTGNDSELIINTHAGDDRVHLDNVHGFKNDVQISTGDHNDFVWARGISVNDDFKVHTSSGADRVVLINIAAEDVRVETGSGNDHVDLFNVDALDDFYVHLGDGDDYLEIEASSGIDVSLFGGSGTDTLKKAPATGYYANTFDSVAKSNGFESFI
jgi:hypothetical protein